MKKSGYVVGMVVFVMSLIFTGCPSGTTENVQVFTVSIGALTNGSITANPTSGIKGTEITLTVTPENLYRLKTGSLKFGTTAIDELSMSFSLPAENVIITAEFESVFFGTWNISQYITDRGTFIFHENIFTWQNAAGRYIYKGTWSIQAPDKLVFTFTHQGNAETIENLPERDTELIQELIFELISCSEFKMTFEHNPAFVLTRLE